MPPAAMRAAAAEARALARAPLTTLYALAARSSLPLGRVLLRLVADADVLPTTKESTMDKPHLFTLDMNKNGTPDYAEISAKVRAVATEPEFIQQLARDVVKELKSHPHTLFSRLLAKVKAAGEWLAL